MSISHIALIVIMVHYLIQKWIIRFHRNSIQYTQKCQILWLSLSSRAIQLSSFFTSPIILIWPDIVEMLTRIAWSISLTLRRRFYSTILLEVDLQLASSTLLIFMICTFATEFLEQVSYSLITNGFLNSWSIDIRGNFSGVMTNLELNSLSKNE